MAAVKTILVNFTVAKEYTVMETDGEEHAAWRWKLNNCQLSIITVIVMNGIKNATRNRKTNNFY